MIKYYITMNFKNSLSLNLNQNRQQFIEILAVYAVTVAVTTCCNKYKRGERFTHQQTHTDLQQLP